MLLQQHVISQIQPYIIVKLTGNKEAVLSEADCVRDTAIINVFLVGSEFARSLKSTA